MTGQQFLLEFLQKSIKRASGISISLATEETPLNLYGGVIDDIHVCSAWIGFKHDGNRYRTATYGDRKRFEEWYTSAEPAVFNSHPNFEGVYGPPNVSFTKVLLVRGKMEEALA
jgi:hypothetical protein